MRIVVLVIVILILIVICIVIDIGIHLPRIRPHFMAQAFLERSTRARTRVASPLRRAPRNSSEGTVPSYSESMPQISEGFAEMHETCKEIKDHLRSISEALPLVPKEFVKLCEQFEYVYTKAASIELRQCMTRGEGTDCARMTCNYLKGASAMWSSHQKAQVVETLYEKGTIKAIEYHGLFRAKDTRRSEFACAVFWVTFVEGSEKLFDVTEDSEVS